MKNITDLFNVKNNEMLQAINIEPYMIFLCQIGLFQTTVIEDKNVAILQNNGSWIEENIENKETIKVPIFRFENKPEIIAEFLQKIRNSNNLGNKYLCAVPIIYNIYCFSKRSENIILDCGLILSDTRCSDRGLVCGPLPSLKFIILKYIKQYRKNILELNKSFTDT